MAIVLNRLAATGPTQVDAEIIFHPQRYLIRGPSDTGKSYIRDCLWYLLGGDKIPKWLPESDGYDSLLLEISSGDDIYEFTRGISGGAVAVHKILVGQNGQRSKEKLDVDEGDLLVKLSGAEGKQLLRSKSKKGAVTGGDLRHWFLLSQPNVISEDATSGSDFNATQRIGAFNLFLTGNDDTAIELAKTTSEVERINGQLKSIEDAISRANAGLPPDVTRTEVQDALARVEEAFSALTTQYEARASKLKQLRVSVSSTADTLHKAQANRDHSASMIERFVLLDQKYTSDLERLGATNEGVALFQALAETSCPLCGTSFELQIDPKHLTEKTQERFRQALIAEIEKICVLRQGLLISLMRERERFNEFDTACNENHQILNQLEKLEAVQLNATRVEFSADPRTLAIRLSELSAQLHNFDEIERLNAELERLAKAKIRRKIPLIRDGGNSSTIVSDFAKQLINDWGFDDVKTVFLDAQACDLVINNRPRLGYGAGKRAIFLAAMTIALLKNAMVRGYPHYGVIVIDSPLKAYSDPTNNDSNDVAVSTVTEKFYSWLSKWQGPGQIIILENENISEATAKSLSPEQFTGINGIGRPGFYPRTINTQVKNT